MKKQEKCKFQIFYVNDSINIFNTCMAKSANMCSIIAGFCEYYCITDVLVCRNWI